MPARSKAQRRLMGMALRVKKGEMKRSDASEEVLRLADTMSQQSLEDYAKTSEDDLPDKTSLEKSADKKKEKEDANEELVYGGRSMNMSIDDIAAKHGVPVEEIEAQLDMGIKVESEHTTNEDLAREIAMDHLAEFPDYYTALDKMEKELSNEEAMASPSNVPGMGPVILPSGGKTGSGDIPFLLPAKKKFDKFKYIPKFENFNPINENETEESVLKDLDDILDYQKKHGTDLRGAAKHFIHEEKPKLSLLLKHLYRKEVAGTNPRFSVGIFNNKVDKAIEYAKKHNTTVSDAFTKI